jgi:hypothetical protein
MFCIPDELQLRFPYLADEMQRRQQHLSHSPMNQLILCQVEIFVVIDDVVTTLVCYTLYLIRPTPIFRIAQGEDICFAG